MNHPTHSHMHTRLSQLVWLWSSCFKETNKSTLDPVVDHLFLIFPLLVLDNLIRNNVVKESGGLNEWIYQKEVEKEYTGGHLAYLGIVGKTLLHINTPACPFTSLHQPNSHLPNLLFFFYFVFLILISFSFTFIPSRKKHKHFKEIC